MNDETNKTTFSLDITDDVTIVYSSGLEEPYLVEDTVEPAVLTHVKLVTGHEASFNITESMIMDLHDSIDHLETDLNTVEDIVYAVASGTIETSIAIDTFANLSDALGVTNVDYKLRDDIPETEEAILQGTNLIIVLKELINIAK